MWICLPVLIASAFMPPEFWLIGLGTSFALFLGNQWIRRHDAKIVAIASEYIKARRAWPESSGSTPTVHLLIRSGALGLSSNRQLNRVRKLIKDHAESDPMDQVSSIKDRDALRFLKFIHKNRLRVDTYASTVAAVMQYQMRSSPKQPVDNL